jgi:hypothetical protein
MVGSLAVVKVSRGPPGLGPVCSVLGPGCCSGGLRPRLLKSWPRLERALVCSFTGFYEYVCYYNAFYMCYICHYLTVEVNEHTFYDNFNIFWKRS